MFLIWKFLLEILEKRLFFRADMAGLGIYHMGGYGRIGVCRVKCEKEKNIGHICSILWVEQNRFLLFIIHVFAKN